jgi:DNA-binding ferritin-like protein
MKNLKDFKSFNEAKIAIVKKSELDANWSAEYNVSSDIAKIKKDLKNLGKSGLIKKVISIVEKIGDDNYKDTVSYVKKEFNKGLPSFDKVIKEDYWKRKFINISDLIIILGSINPAMKLTKEKIEKEIETFKERLKNIEKMNESISRTYTEFTEDFEDALKNRFSNMTEDQIWDALSYFHDKTYLHDLWEDGASPNAALDNLIEKEGDTKVLKWFK